MRGKRRKPSGLIGKVTVWLIRKITVILGLCVVALVLAIAVLYVPESGQLPEISGPFISYDHLASEDSEPYLVRGKPPGKSADIRAARRWTDVRSCLKSSEHGADKLDLRKMDWGKMRRKEDVEVCLFRIAASLRSPEGMRDWFISQGMQYVEVTKREKLSNVRPEDVWEVAAINRFSTGKTYRASPIPWRYWIMFISRGENFTVWHLESGGIFGTHYSDNNIL